MHTDSIFPGKEYTGYRNISLIMALNSNYTGGEFHFPVAGNTHQSAQNMLFKKKTSARVRGATARVCVSVEGKM